MQKFKRIIFTLLTTIFVFGFCTSIKAAEAEPPVNDDPIEAYESYGATFSTNNYTFTYYDPLGISHSVVFSGSGAYVANWNEGFSGWVSPCWGTITSLSIDGLSRNLYNSYDYNGTAGTLRYSFYDPTGSYVLSVKLVLHFYCDEWGTDYGYFASIE